MNSALLVQLKLNALHILAKLLVESFRQTNKYLCIFYWQTSKRIENG